MSTRPVIATIFLIAACSRETPPPRAPEPAAPTPAPQPAASAKSPERATVQIAEDIRRACGIADVDAHFGFDSSRLLPGEQPTLQKLVTCFVSGPLRGRNMRLVGHADPRGDSEYNLVLGGSRADNVMLFLVGSGLPRALVASTSRGEMDAKGTDERTWAEDRRVDVMLAQ